MYIFWLAAIAFTALFTVFGYMSLGAGGAVLLFVLTAGLFWRLKYVTDRGTQQDAQLEARRRQFEEKRRGVSKTEG